MFGKILVCLDGSDLAEKILPYVIQQAEHFESEIVLLRVYNESALVSLAVPGIPGIPVETAAVEQRLAEERTATQDYLAMMLETMKDQTKRPLSSEVVRGSPGPAIIEYCQKNGVELVALATHGRSGAGRVVLGSVADYVIRHTGLPLLLIRPPK
jgi:nucleotide-binding universal stress UspA family protein